MRSIGTPVKPRDERFAARAAHHRQADARVRDLRARLVLGGPEKYRQREKERGKLLARERVTALFDAGAPFLETGLLVAHDLYDGEAPGAGVVTGVGLVHGRQVVVVANDATVKSGAWWPQTIGKILRAQEIAMRCRVPIVYLVDSAGVNLPYQEGVFPGQHGAARIFHYNSVMRRLLGVPQIAAVMGQCVAGGAYLPALSDVMLMTRGSSFMGLGGPKLVYGALRERVDSETLGGAVTHTTVSGVAHYIAEDDADCLDRIRDMIARLAPPARTPLAYTEPAPPAFDPSEIPGLLPRRHQQGYDMHEILARLVDGSLLDEFQEGFAAELICAHARIEGIPLGLLANQRVPTRPAGHQRTLRLGGVFYPESARKAAEFIRLCDRQGVPLLFIQDVTGFMVGTEAEREGIIRFGADMVEAMATCRVPKISLTVGHASGAGYYAMAGQGFDPDFIFTWPTGRMGVMEGESAVQALFGGDIEKLAKEGKTIEDSPTLKRRVEKTREDYERQLDPVFAGARGLVDGIILPEETRMLLALALATSLNTPGPHLGSFQLPASVREAGTDRPAGGLVPREAEGER
jgi:acetyl-CoA carboxylase carboxyltransferase component